MPFALEAGIDSREYWYYTITEINNTIVAYRANLATQAQLNYTLADLIGKSVARLFIKNAKFPTVYEVYPGLITKPERPQASHWELSKARLLNYAASHNADRRNRGEK